MRKLIIKLIINFVVFIVRKMTTEKFRYRVVSYAKKNKVEAVIIAMIVIILGSISFVLFPDETQTVIQSVSEQTKDIQLLESD